MSQIIYEVWVWGLVLPTGRQMVYSQHSHICWSQFDLPYCVFKATEVCCVELVYLEVWWSDNGYSPTFPVLSIAYVYLQAIFVEFAFLYPSSVFNYILELGFGNYCDVNFKVIFALCSRTSLCFMDLIFTVTILSCLTSWLFWWVWICFRFLTFILCCLLLLFRSDFFLCCILFCISSSLILIVLNGNPDRLTNFADFLRFNSCDLLYMITMISVTKVGIKMLNISATILC